MQEIPPECDDLIERLWIHFAKDPATLSQYGPSNDNKFGFSGVDQWTIPIANCSLPDGYNSWEDYLSATLSEVELGHQGYRERDSAKRTKNAQKKKAKRKKAK